MTTQILGEIPVNDPDMCIARVGWTSGADGGVIMHLFQDHFRLTISPHQAFELSELLKSAGHLAQHHGVPTG